VTAAAPATRAGTPAAAAPAAKPPAVELTAKEQRALREEARREARAKFKAAEVERLTDAEAKKRGVPAPSSAPAAAPSPAGEPLDPNRTDGDRRADAAVFLRGVVWPLLSLGSLLLGFDLGELTEAMAKEDAASWVPLARRYRWLDLLFTWAGAPARLIARVKELKRKREPKPKEPTP
jgi:hypothetical protein